LIGIDPFLPRASNALQKKFDLMFERRDLPLLLRKRCGELRRDRFMLDLRLLERIVRLRQLVLRLHQQLFESFVFALQVHCVHTCCYERSSLMVLFLTSNSHEFQKENAGRNRAGRRKRVGSVCKLFDFNSRWF